jgi:hypothetical protein
MGLDNYIDGRLGIFFDKLEGTVSATVRQEIILYWAQIEALKDRIHTLESYIKNNNLEVPR